MGACNEDRTPDLHGAWQATLLVEEGDTVEVRLDDVGIQFKPDGSYVYTSTLDYAEEGNYHLDGEYLYRTPTGADPEGILPVEIAALDSTRLHFNMVDSGKARRLEFLRVELPDNGQLNDFGDDHIHDDHHDDHDHGHEH